MGNKKLQMRKSGTKSRITKSEAQTFRRRWEIVNNVEKKMLRITSADEKLGQLTMLMSLAKELDWKSTLEAEVRQIRDRWNKLRKVYHA